MGFIEGRTRFGKGIRPTIYFAILAAVLTLPVVLLLAFPARALADADLSITKHKQGPPRVEPLEEFDYVLTVSNEGADAATSVQVVDKLPMGVTFLGYEAPGGVSCVIAVDTVTCNVPTLAAGESKTITLNVRAPSNVGVIENKATASAAEDPNSPKTSNKLTTTVAPNLVIEKLSDPDPVDTEDVLLYTLRIENDGSGPAAGVGVTDELPLDDVDFLSVDSQDFDCMHTAGVIQCNADHTLAPDEIVKVTIAVEPEKAGTIENTGAVFAQGVREPLDTDTETTKVNGGGGNGGGGNGGGNNGGGGNGGDVPRGDQCSPVINTDTEESVGVISGTEPEVGTFENDFNGTLPLRIAYATSSENGTLTITVTPKDGGEAVLDKTIKGKKRGVVEVNTESGSVYDVEIIPEDQGFAIQLQIGSGTEPCKDPSDLDPPAAPGGDDGTNDDSGVNGADDVIDDTISDNPLPNTGGPSLVGLAVIALGLSVLGGATVVRSGVRRRDR